MKSICLTYLLVCITIVMGGCFSSANSSNESKEAIGEPATPVEPAMPSSSENFITGADISYINQMEDCGVSYLQDSMIKDPYDIMADAGAGIARVRLWFDPMAHPPFPNIYSGIDDVEKTIRRSKAAGMQVMLDIHYSDQWADPGKQWIPDEWKSDAGDVEALQQRMYDYSKAIIERLKVDGLVPEYVQVGNETNGNILVPYEQDSALYPTDFGRQALLMQAGINGIRDGAQGSNIIPKIILHVAGPKNLRWWVSNINAQPIDYDIVGLSYYAIWSTYTIAQVGDLIEQVTEDFGRPVMVVETAVPWTAANNGDSPNIQSSMPSGYAPATPENQNRWLIDLRDELVASGALGMVYWEPAWVTTSCDTQWGIGSSWENAGFFDFQNNLITEGGVQFLSLDEI